MKVHGYANHCLCGLPVAVVVHVAVIPVQPSLIIAAADVAHANAGWRVCVQQHFKHTPPCLPGGASANPKAWLWQ